MVNYDGLLNRLAERKITKTTLIKELGISSRTIAKIGKGEKIAEHVLNKIALYLNCRVEDLYCIVSDNVLLQVLRDEKRVSLSGGLYHELQIRMTYNSNHMEGSKLSEDQTRMIFETNTIDGADGILVDDVIETVNHFRAIDYVIDHAELPLTENLIKELHFILKQSTKDSMLSWFKVGEYKVRANVVGGKETTKPSDVSKQMRRILSIYESLNQVTIEDIISFHYEFECIHPFQDGNGRVGRLIVFKECLRHKIVPFIIEDSKKMYYYRGLSQWKAQRGFLMDTCSDGQDTFRKLMAMFDIEE